MRFFTAICLASVFVVCAKAQDASDTARSGPEGYRPPPGSNEVLRAGIDSLNDHEVIISDVVIPPETAVPAHYHPTEEYLYVIEGSVLHREEGKPDRILKAGQTYVIPPRIVHAPRGGPDGARVVVFRVHIKGAPETVPAGDE